MLQIDRRIGFPQF